MTKHITIAKVFPYLLYLSSFLILQLQADQVRAQTVSQPDQKEYTIKKEKQRRIDRLIDTAFQLLDSNPERSLILSHQIETELVDYNDMKFVYSIRAYAYANLGDHESELGFREYVIALDLPNSREVQRDDVNLAHCLTNLGRFDEALTHYDHINYRLLNDDTIHSNVYLFKAHCYFQLNQYTSCILNADSALQSPLLHYFEINRPDDIIEVEREKSIALRETGRYNEGLICIQTAIKNCKDNDSSKIKPLLSTRGIMYYYLRNYNLAVHDLRIAIPKDNDAYYADLYFYLGMCYRNLGLLKDACKELSIAAEFDYPDAVEAMKNCN